MRNGRRLGGFLLVSVLLAVVAGCGAPFFISDEELAVILGKEYLYAGGDLGVDAYDVDVATGRITKLAGSPFGAGCIGALTAAPSGSFLYSMPFLSNTVYGFRVERDGKLATLSGFPYSASPSSPTAMTIDPAQSFAYITHSGSAQALTSYRFDAGTGGLTLLPGTLGVGCSPYDAVVDPGGRFLYVSTALPPYLTSYAVETGMPAGPLGSVNTGVGVIRMALDPAGPYLYGILGTTSDKNIVGYRIDSSSGALMSVSGSPYRLGFGPGNISATGLAVDDWGAYLYASGSDDRLYQYRIDGDTGSLSITHGLGSANGAKLSVSHSGRYVFAGGDDNLGVGVIRVYEVASDGSLSEIAGSPFPQSGGPLRDLETINSHSLP